MTSTSLGVVSNVDSLYVVEYACSKGSKCNGFECSHQAIEKKELRIGKLFKSRYGNRKYGTDYQMIAKWFHVPCNPCLFEELVNSRAGTHIITSPKDFRVGWDLISSEDRQKIERHMANLIKIREEQSNNKNKTNKNAKLDNDANSEEEEEQQHSNKKAKKKSKKDKDNDDDTKGSKRKKSANKVESDAEKPKKKSKKKEKEEKVVPTATTALVEATFSYDIWVRVLEDFSLQDLLQFSLVSNICHKASRQVLFNHRGLKFLDNLDASLVPASISSAVSKLSLLQFKKFDFLPLFSNLSSLHIEQSDYDSHLGDSLHQLTKLSNLSLRTLRYSGNGSRSFIDKVLKLPLLRTLNIYGCSRIAGGRDYAEWYSGFTSLTSLTLSANQLHGDLLPACENWTNLQNLTYLDLSNTPILPGCITIFQKMNGLTFLGVEVPHTEKDAYDFSSLSNLSSFLIQTHSWKNVILPPNLRVLYIQDFTHKEDIPPITASVKNIHIRALGIQPWKDLPNYFGHITKHCFIHLSCNLDSMSILPPAIMPQIASLNLYATSWPKNRFILDLMENAAAVNENEKNPPSISFYFDMHSCSYKKKVYETVERLKVKSNIKVNYNYDKWVFRFV